MNIKKPSEPSGVETIDDEDLSTREAAALLGVSLRTVQLWVEAGQLTAWKTAGGHRRIPRSAVEEHLARRAQQLSGTAPKARKRILVVEDDPLLRQLYDVQIAHWNADVDVDFAEDGFQGLLKVGANPPDCLITDLAMPGMNGFQMIQRLRTEPKFANIQMVVVTAFDPHDLNSGALPDDIEVLTKPVQFARLRDIVLGRA